MSDLHFTYRIGISTISLIIKEVCRAVWYCLKNSCMPLPDKERWLAISNDFLQNSDFPNCIGAIDGKHVRVIKPSNSGSLYYNYKNYFSVQLLAICDANYCFIYVDIGDYGKNNDASIFNTSEFNKRLQEGILDIPGPNYLPGTNDYKLPYVLIGDEAFALTQSMMRPYGGKHLALKQRIYNYRLSRARRFIECSFGILTNKWRIFHRALNVDIELAIDIIKACVVLHNFVRIRDGYVHGDTISYTGLLDNNEEDNFIRTGNRIAEIRNRFAEWFITEGDVHWQYSKI